MMGVSRHIEPVKTRGWAAIFALLAWLCASSWLLAASPVSASTVTNTAQVDYETSHNVPMPSEISTAVLTVLSPAIHVTISAPATTVVGDNITYSITVGNPGGIKLTGVKLTDSVPVGTTFVSADSGGTLTSGVITWDAGSLDTTATTTVHFTVSTDVNAPVGSVVSDRVDALCDQNQTDFATAATTLAARTPGVVIFTDSSYNKNSNYEIGDIIYIRVTDPDRNVDPAVPDRITVVVYHYMHLTDGRQSVDDQETVTLTETGPNTGVFTGSIASNGGSPSIGDGIVTLARDTRIEVVYTDPLDKQPVHDDVALIDPLGTVFDSNTGLPVTGAVVTLIDDDHGGVVATLPQLPIAQINPVTTTADGKFQFKYVYAGNYHIEVAFAPGVKYAFPSKANKSELPSYYTIDGSSYRGIFYLAAGADTKVVDIPVDPPAGAIDIVKTSDRTCASIGDTIGYIIKVTNGSNTTVKNLKISDVMPHDIVYIKGSSRLDGSKTTDPVIAGGSFAWTVGDLAAGASVELRYRASVGPDSVVGDVVNTAYAIGRSSGADVVSRPAYCRVAISEGIFTSKGIILGKVFEDKNTDGDQQAGEKGMAGVVLYLEDGSRVITDKDGKYSIPGVEPGTHIIKVDTASLPEGATLAPTSNRSMGDADSQFVDLRPSGLSKANFAVILSKTDTAAVQPSAAAQTEAPAAEEDLEDRIKGFTPDLEILSPADGEVVTKSVVKVVVKAPLKYDVLLFVNGVQTGQDRVGKKVIEDEKMVAAYEYIGINLAEKGDSVIKVQSRDPFGNIRDTKEVKVLAPVRAANLTVGPDKEEVPADGSSKLHVTVNAVDEHGRPARIASFVTIMTSRGEVVQPDMDKMHEGTQIPYFDKGAEFDILSPRESGEATVTVSVDELTQSFKVFFSPPSRPIMAVGIGELKVGYGNTGGVFYSKTDSGLDKGLSAEGRGAFFLKGSVYRDIFVTASYDSDKKQQPDLMKAAATDYQTDDKYRIYGDESKLGYEAQSAAKLYLKLEKDRSSVLYGDYNTGFDETRLAAYRRTLTGVKAELGAYGVRVRGFASFTDQTQVVDTLPAKGISGYYYLSHQPVIEGSEKISIETRDRLRPDVVLDRTYMSRGTDYYIESDTGRVLFKAPVPSYDPSLNPVYIIVVYESRQSGAKHYIYGGRVTADPRPWLRTGITAAVEEQDAGDYRLGGLDVRMLLPYKTELKAEYATTDSLMELNNTVSQRQGSAYSIDLLSVPNGRLNISGYYHKADDFFNNPSATDVMRGTTKLGGEVKYLPRENIVLYMKALREDDDLNSTRHDLASVGAEIKYDRYKLKVDLMRETSTTKIIPQTGADSRLPFDNTSQIWNKFSGLGIGFEARLYKSLSLDLTHRQDLQNGGNHLSSAGLKYQIDEKNRLYLREEYLQTESNAQTRTVAGIESILVRNTTGYTEYRLTDGADGARNQQVFGLKNTFSLTKKLNGSASFEYLKTFSGLNRLSEADAVAATFGMEYLLRDDLKATGRVEYRHELATSGNNSFLIEQATAYRLDRSLTLLFQERFSNEVYGATASRHTVSRTSLSGAYRPADNDRLNGLLKLEYKYDNNTSSDSGLNTSAMIVSTDWCLQATKKTRVTAKYAGKLVTQAGTGPSYTQLIAVRALHDLTDRFDVGVEYRVLNNSMTGSFKQGGSVEVGCKVYKNIWCTVGYSFDRFDSDLKQDNHRSQGPYFMVRFKADEKAFNKR